MFSNFWSKYVMGGDARPSGRVPKRVDAGNLEGKTLPCSGSLCFPQERYPHRGEARGNCCECHSPLSTVSVPSATCRRHRSTYGDATVSGECQAFGDDDDGGRSLNQLKCRSYSAAGVYPAPRAEGVELGQTPGGGRTLSGVRLPERETCSETSEKIASLAHGGMQDRSVLQPVRSCGSIKDTEKERIVRSASTTRLSNMSLVYFEDHLVNDADVVGSALGKPMTPQSYSSLMFSSDFEMLSIADEGIMRRLTSGATQSLSSHQLMAVASGVATPPPARTRYSNSGPNDHEQYVQIPGHPCSEVSRLCGCANSPCRGNTENTGTAQSMNAQHCTECACGPVAAASLSTGCLLPSVGKAVKNSVQCPSSQCALHPSALTRERMVVSVPPDPKDLLTVNAGSPRVDFLQRNVINCCVAVKRPLSSGKIIINGKYVVYSDHCLGVGSYSKVFLCYCLYEKMFYAMKIYNRGKLRRKGFGVNSPVNKVRREVDIMRKLKHQNIVSLVEVIDDPSSHKMYMVIEFAERGAIMSLENNGTVVSNAYGSGLGEEGVARIIRCVVGALIYAHENRVVHRDVKTQNILVNAEGCAKLSDFGVSMVLDGSTTTAYREGTVAFLPPEMLSSFEVRIEPGHLPSHKQCTADNGEGSFQQGSQLYDGATKVPAAEESMGDTACLETTRCNASSVPEASNSVGDVLGKDSAALSSAGRENIPQVDLFKVDVFALGVTTFVLLMGRLPWRAGSSRSQIKAIYAEPDPFERELQESSGSLHEDEQRDCVLCDECSLGCEDLTGHDGCSVRTLGEQLTSQRSSNMVPRSGWKPATEATVANQPSNFALATCQAEEKCGERVYAEEFVDRVACSRAGGGPSTGRRPASHDAVAVEGRNTPHPVRRTPWQPHRCIKLHTTKSSGSSFESACTDVREGNECSSKARTTTNSSSSSYSDVEMARKGEAEGNVPSTRLRCFAATEGARCNHVGFASSSLLPPPHGAAAPSTTGGASSHSNSDQPDNSQQTTVSHAHSCGLEGSPSIKGIVLPIGATSVSASTHTRGTVRRGACGCRKWTGLRGLPATDTHKEISAEAIDFIRCCLRINPAERSTMKELCDTPWLKMVRHRDAKGGAPN